MALYIYEKYSSINGYSWRRYNLNVTQSVRQTSLGEGEWNYNTMAWTASSYTVVGDKFKCNWVLTNVSALPVGSTFYTYGSGTSQPGELQSSIVRRTKTHNPEWPSYDFPDGIKNPLYSNTSLTITSSTTKGTYVGTVTSTNINAYPTNGASGGYWYDTRIASYTRGDYIGDVIAEDKTLPDDGRHTDGYWYVKKDSANKAPTISGVDEDLGGKLGEFFVEYFVDDPDLTQELIVVERINGITINTRTNAERKRNYRLTITNEMLLTYGINQVNNIEISVSDGAGATAYRRKTFRRINSPPVITLPLQDLGEQNEPFNFKYTVTDPENDKVNVEIKYNGKVLAVIPNVALGVEQTYTIDKLNYCMIFNGAHSLIITATDEYGANSSKNVAFSKNVHGCGYILNGDTDTLAQYIIVEATYKLFPGEEFKVQVTNNFNDPEPVWATIELGKVYEFTNTTHVNTPAIGVRAEVLPDPKLGDSYFYSYIAKWGVRNGG